MFAKSTCPFCQRVEDVLDSLELQPEPNIVYLDHDKDGSKTQSLLAQLTGILELLKHQQRNRLRPPKHAALIAYCIGHKCSAQLLLALHPSN